MRWLLPATEHLSLSASPMHGTGGGGAPPELLPVPYAHVVFTLPSQLGRWPCRIRARSTDCLFRASPNTADGGSRRETPGADIGSSACCIRGNQKMQHHRMSLRGSAGGLSPDHTRWICGTARILPSGACPQPGVSGQVRSRLRQLHAPKLGFYGRLTDLGCTGRFAAMHADIRSDWVSMANARSAGRARAPLSRCYTHRSRSPIPPDALEDGEVVFRWRDSAHKNKKRLMRLDLNEFLRRFLLHVLPKASSFVTSAFFSHRRRAGVVSRCASLS